MIRVLIADDHVPIRRAFAALIDSDEDLQVVAEASTGREAVERALATLPQVILMDVRMPVMDGIEATRQISDEFALRHTRVLMLTTFDLDEYVYDALRAGASGFLLKDAQPDDLLRAIRIVAAGDALLAPRVTRRLIAQFTANDHYQPTTTGVFDCLTGREREIVCLVARGMSNQDIADQLFISPLTVKTHLSHAATKLGCRDRAQIVTLAFEHRLIRPGS
ncbi:MAG: response regulator transcription factor [Micromonosporaceae bacterium]|nr:response regulator transcription factor [Micromonosporaceae bacterium]